MDLFEARFAEGSGFKGGKVNGGDLGERLEGGVGTGLGCQYGLQKGKFSLLGDIKCGDDVLLFEWRAAAPEVCTTCVAPELLHPLDGEFFRNKESLLTFAINVRGYPSP